MNIFKLNSLPEELVNQIAAGEVIERPASVIKELVDNSIDAKAKKIHIKVINGGIDLIEVSDDGVGIPKESLGEIFKAHTTSKIASLEDLNTLLTMGFRGEALSTIVSVSEVSMISKYIDSDTGSEIIFKNFNEYDVRNAPREVGTVISVKNIFKNIPARRKFLKTAQTEYKKILEILYSYFLIYPNIHFIVEKDGKQVINLLPVDTKDTISKDRVNEVIREDFVNRMIKVFYDGNGIKISGLTAHPSDHQKRSSNQYIFVNRRPVWDNGIARAIVSGYERYIPFGERVPFILSIEILPDQIDVNVHPRKEEIRFVNPFRAYIAIEEAIKKSISGVTSYKIDSEYHAPQTIQQFSTESRPSIKAYSPKDISFKTGSSGSVRDSLLFSKEVLSETSYVQEEKEKLPEYIEDSNEFRNIFQIFNKYIVIEFENDTLWIIDQHAAAERITFEKLKKTNSNSIEKQNLLVPIEIQFSVKEIETLKSLSSFFKDLGFEYIADDNIVKISIVPVEFVSSDFKKFFDEIFSLSEDVMDLSKNISKLKEDILATISCHGSVRSGQRLHREEMIEIYRKLVKCENPYSCPHGRPAVWKMKLSEIDSNFERTY